MITEVIEAVPTTVYVELCPRIERVSGDLFEGRKPSFI
jgi:hypothetical protein